MCQQCQHCFIYEELEYFTAMCSVAKCKQSKIIELFRVFHDMHGIYILVNIVDIFEIHEKPLVNSDVTEKLETTKNNLAKLIPRFKNLQIASMKCEEKVHYKFRSNLNAPRDLNENCTAIHYICKYLHQIITVQFNSVIFHETSTILAYICIHINLSMKTAGLYPDYLSIFEFILFIFSNYCKMEDY